jgi:hypothetical protein
MSRASSTDAPITPNPPPPVYKGHLRLGRARSLPITAGDQGDPKGGLTTPPLPGDRVDDGFVMALLASEPRATPMNRAMVVEGTPLQQDYRFAAGTPSFSDDEDNSPPLLSDLEPSAASASTKTMAAAFTPNAVAAALAEISDSSDQLMANERLRNRDYNSNMASLGGRLSQFEQIFSEVRESIGTVQAESASLVVLNMNTCTVVGESIKDFIRAMENTNKKNAVALEEYERRIFDMTAVHTKSMGDMQAKLQGSFDRM